VLLDRLVRGTAGQSMVVKGLRGVGKTVLLNTFEDVAVERDWLTVFKECDESTSLPAIVARHCHRLLGTLKPGAKLAGRVREALGRLDTFTLKDPAGFEIAFGFKRGQAGVDALGDDFTDLLVALGSVAAERGRGVVFLFDEVQFLHPSEFGPFVVGLHRINQKALPVTCVAAGLPSLPALAGEARTYAERLFTYPTLGPLPREAAYEALAWPARVRDVEFEKQALALAYERTAGYPYFVQEYGKYAWNVASGRRIKRADVERGGELAQSALDEGFFLVRAERATEAERRFLRAIAYADQRPVAVGEVVRALGKRSSTQTSGQRDALIKKGLVYSPRTGWLDFTVPLFDDYIRRRYSAL
jgi:hypothetical protein